MTNAAVERNAVEFYTELQKQDSIDACALIFKGAIEKFGFDTFACGEVDLAHRDRNVFYIIDWPESWRKFYIGNGLLDRDPLIGALSARRKSFTWSDLRKDKTISQIGRDAIRLAAEYGWSEGLAVAVPRGETRFGLVSLVGHSEDLVSYDRALLCLMSECLLARIRSLERRPTLPAPPAGLSMREIDCIRLVALGYSDREIADTLSISQSTAHQHVEGGRRKLHAKTRAHMAALGVSLGIVDGG